MSILSDDEFDQECDYCGLTFNCKCKESDFVSTAPKEFGGWETYCLFNALKLHFSTDSYDFFKYNGKTKNKQDSFLNSRHKYFFYKLSRKYTTAEDAKNFFVSNFIINDKLWVGDLLNDDAASNYNAWQKRVQSLTYGFSNDLDYMLTQWRPVDWLKVPYGTFPVLLSELMGGRISIETVVILNDLMDFLPMWKRKVDDDIIFPDWYRRIRKYTPFVNYDKMKFKEIVKTKVRENDR